MSRKGKGTIENPLTQEDLENLKEGNLVRGYKITEAFISDDYCNYKFEVTDKIGFGDEHSVKGKGIIKDSLKDAFAALNVHLACIDDSFINIDKETASFHQFLNDDSTFRYRVRGIKVRGSGDGMTVILYGTKRISLGGLINIDTPKIALDNLSGYQWYNELKESVEKILEEVSLYREGNYIDENPVDNDDENQMSLFDQEESDLFNEESAM